MLLFLHARFPELDPILSNKTWTKARTKEELLLFKTYNFPYISRTIPNTDFLAGQILGKCADIPETQLKKVSNVLLKHCIKLTQMPIKVGRKILQCYVPLYHGPTSPPQNNMIPTGLIRKTGKLVFWMPIYKQHLLYSIFKKIPPLANKHKAQLNSQISYNHNLFPSGIAQAPSSVLSNAVSTAPSHVWWT